MSARPAWTWRTDLFARSFLGFLIAPLTAGVFAGLGFWLITLPGGGLAEATSTGVLESLAMAVIVGVGAGASVALPIAFIAGWPVHGLLMWKRLRGAVAYGCTGAGLAGLASLAYSGPGMFLPDALSITATVFLLTAASGAVGAYMFWLIRRPDRDSTKLDPA